MLCCAAAAAAGLVRSQQHKKGEALLRRSHEWTACNCAMVALPATALAGLQTAGAHACASVHLGQLLPCPVSRCAAPALLPCAGCTGTSGLPLLLMGRWPWHWPVSSRREHLEAAAAVPQASQRAASRCFTCPSSATLQGAPRCATAMVSTRRHAAGAGAGWGLLGDSGRRPAALCAGHHSQKSLPACTS